VVVGVDSFQDPETGEYKVYQYTGDESKTKLTSWTTVDWVQQAEALGAGEIVLNCMNQDGVRQGYDVAQLSKVRAVINIPLIASGGAGALEHFTTVFKESDVDGALAASVFHKGVIDIQDLKSYLRDKGIEVRK